MSGQFNKLAIDTLEDFVYGTAPRPLKLAGGMAIGGGTVYPEINFTLPPMDISDETMDEVKRHYTEMIEGVLTRARELNVPGLVVEVELLPPATMRPEWGIEITKIVREAMHEYESRHGLKSVMRITPNDVRDMIRPPRMSGGQMLDAMLETFRGCALSGAELLAIESTGGKEVHDDALLACDLPTVIFSLGVMGARDMARLWNAIVAIARETGSIPSGDTACGFGNTAMMLAEKGYIPRVFAAVVRVITVVRSLVAYEVGAVGPSKDCAYEGPYIKAITGYPIAMEGKSAACAHLSPLGNIPAAVADLWSNESVQNIKLLGGMAPTVSMEQLAYDCRLMNTAGQEGKGSARKLRDWL
ncbi:MAG TPA: methanol--corrinoid methyltransferase, partial [Firmicutes bacterium]|nr:methanol--corrinoid methyltransferase [Bacillota bacterium]